MRLVRAIRSLIRDVQKAIYLRALEMYLAFANYRDGAGRVVQHDVRYRAEAHAIEAAATARADDK